MRALLGLFLGVTVVIILLPVLIIGGWQTFAKEAATPVQDIMLKLYVTGSEQMVEIGLEEYVKAVVAAEMPATFHPEALKAQAVAARTYAVKRALAFGGRGCSAHTGADVCDDPAHCQAWLPAADLQKKWGMIQYQDYWGKISQAVEATAGLVVTYGGVVIDPLFHSTCGGLTEAASAVWQQDLPYLKPMRCDYCSHSPKLTAEHRFSLSTFAAVMHEMDGSIAVTAAAFKTTSSPLLTMGGQTVGDRVSHVSLAGEKIEATALRHALGLNSTRFTFTIEGEDIVFHTRGYGHGVGLCQYGADGMGQAGHDYRAILAHYYQGTTIINIR